MIQFAIQLAVGLVALIIVVTAGVYIASKFVEWRTMRRELKEASDATSP
jgi:hypothetical protein